MKNVRFLVVVVSVFGVSAFSFADKPVRGVKAEKPAESRKSVMKEGYQYYWREIEDIFQGRRFRTSKWTPIGYTIEYSGKGAGSMAASSADWRTNIQEVIDQKSLKPETIIYYMWMRVYGYRNPSPITVTYDGGANNRGTVGTFTGKATEKVDADGKYLAPGRFYWQLVGSFPSAGGMTTFTLASEGQFYGDALLITDDPEYRPQDFEAREVAAKRANSFNVLKDTETIYVDPSYLNFGATDQFITPLNFWICAKPGVNFMRPADKPAYVYVALPEWLEAVGVISHWATEWSEGGTAGKHVLEKVGPEMIDGVEYMVYRSNTYKLISRFRFFVKGIPSKIKYGSMSKAYAWLVDGKNVTDKRPVNIEAVHVKPAPQFRNIFIGPMGAPMLTFFKAYSTLPDILQYCGVNMLNTWQSSGVPKQGEIDFCKDFIRRCNERNIAVIDELSPGHPRLSEKPEYALDIQGYPAGQMMALSMDGSSPFIKVFQAEIACIVEAGHSGMSLDDEVYNSAYDTIDFSDKFIDLFKQHLAETKPGLKFVDPKIIVKDQKKYPELYKAWIDFRCERVTNWYRLYREAFDAAMKKYHSNSTFGKTYFIPVIVNSNSDEEAKHRLCFDLKAMMQYCTHISPMIYTFSGIAQSANVGNGIKTLKKVIGTDRDVIAPTLLGGHRGFGEIPPGHMRMVKYQIYECLINKAPGMFFWFTAGFMNPQVLEQVSTALNATVTYERFFTDGKVIQAEVNPPARTDAIELDGQYMIYVTAYGRGEQNVEVTVRIPDAKFTEALDVESEKSLPVVNNTVKIRFDKEYGHMVLLK